MADFDSSGGWQLLADLVAFDTESSRSNSDCAAYLADRLDAAGCRVWLFRDDVAGVEKSNVLAWRGPVEPGGLILSGHMDVVPFRDQPGWTHDPLALTRTGDRVVGRGVADMKGFLAIAVAAAAEPAERGLRRPLVILLTADEEVGCLGAERLLPHLETLRGELPLPAEALIGEPTGLAMYSAHKGHVRLVFRCRGVGGHSSRPDLGANAIAAMGEVIRTVEELAAEMPARAGAGAARLFPEFPATPFNLGTVAGGSADNMIAEECVLAIGFRPLPDDDPHALVNELEQRARDAVGRRYPRVALAVDEVVITPALAPPADLPLARELMAFGMPAPVGAPYATDGGQLARAGIHSLIWGPGELGQAHQPNESLSVDMLLSCDRILRQVVSRRCT